MKKKFDDPEHEQATDVFTEIGILARDLKPYHWGILKQYDDEHYPTKAFLDEIVHIRWAESGAHLWLGFESHTFKKVNPNAIIKVISTKPGMSREKYLNWKLPPPPIDISDPDDNLAARALSCKMWKWLPGMQPRHPKSAPDSWVARVGAERFAKKGLLPDFADEATAGLLLALTRNAYKDETSLWSGRLEVHQDHKFLFFVVQPFHDEFGALQYETISHGRTEIESLIIALENSEDKKA